MRRLSDLTLLRLLQDDQKPLDSMDNLPPMIEEDLLDIDRIRQMTPTPSSHDLASMLQKQPGRDDGFLQRMLQERQSLLTQCQSYMTTDGYLSILWPVSAECLQVLRSATTDNPLIPRSIVILPSEVTIEDYRVFFEPWVHSLVCVVSSQSPVVALLTSLPPHAVFVKEDPELVFPETTWEIVERLFMDRFLSRTCLRLDKAVQWTSPLTTPKVIYQRYLEALPSHPMMTSMVFDGSVMCATREAYLAVMPKTRIHSLVIFNAPVSIWFLDMIGPTVDRISMTFERPVEWVDEKLHYALYRLAHLKSVKLRNVTLPSNFGSYLSAVQWTDIHLEQTFPENGPYVNRYGQPIVITRV